MPLRDKFRLWYMLLFALVLPLIYWLFNLKRMRRKSVSIKSDTLFDNVFCMEARFRRGEDLVDKLICLRKCVGGVGLGTGHFV